MVSLRPLLRFSRALGRQVFPVDGSGGTHIWDEGQSVQGTNWAAGDRALGPCHTSPLSPFPTAPMVLRGVQ